MSKPTVGSLFSGIGGFDLGFERAGWDIIWQVENDPYRQKILKRHWPEVELRGDITADTDGLRRPDLICGGFPCQDVSVAGRHKGLAGERSGLWFEYLRLVKELRPTWVVIENVPGLLYSNKGADFEVVVRGLADSGYGVSWRVLDSRYFGVPQRRRRVFIVGRLGAVCPPEVLFEPESLAWHLEARRKAQAQIAGTLGGSSSIRGWSNDLDRSGAFLPEIVNARQTPITGKQPLDTSGHSLAVIQEEGDTEESRTLTGKRGYRYDGDTETFVVEGIGTEDGQAHALLASDGDRQDETRETYVVQTAYTKSNGRGYRKGASYTLDSGARAQAVVTPTLRGRTGKGGGGTDADRVVAQPLRADRWGGSDSHGGEGNTVVYGPSNYPDGREWHELEAARALSTDGLDGGTPGIVVGEEADAAGVREATGVPGGLDGIEVTDDEDAPAHRYGCLGGCGLAAHCCGYSVCALPNECDANRCRLFLKTPRKERLTPTADGKRYAALGDAVTVTVTTWLGKRLLEAHQSEEEANGKALRQKV